MGKKTKARLSRTIPEIGSVSSAKTVWMRCGELYECIHVAQFNRNWEKCQRKWRNFVIFTRAKSKRINLIICSCLGRSSVASNISSFSHRASTFDLREKSLMWKCFLQSIPPRTHMEPNPRIWLQNLLNAFLYLRFVPAALALANITYCQHICSIYRVVFPGNKCILKMRIYCVFKATHSRMHVKWGLGPLCARGRKRGREWNESEMPLELGLELELGSVP